MHREDNSKFMLYIEPKASEKLQKPIEDGLTRIMERALKLAKTGTANYSNIEDSGESSFNEGSGFRGVHRTECGETSENHEYLLENGYITNSLAPFYLKWYRNSIPETEMKKVMELVDFYSR